MSQTEKSRVQRQFGQNAQKYRDEPLFAAGEDLGHMIEAAQPGGEECLLDVGTGAGHTALAFAPHVSQCIGLDLTEEMVQIATQLADKRGIRNVAFQTGDAEALPFPDTSFDLVTCRLAAHHFPNPAQALQEAARVLKPGGRLLLLDHYAPEDPELDLFINELDRTRDPSHVREYTLDEWEQFFLQAGLTCQTILRPDLELNFEKWVERAQTPPEARTRLIHMMQTASPSCKETFSIRLDAQGQPLSFCLKTALFVGKKATHH
jgi:ubiquinone/menaquinone biosynthesis C-methylase UbiE